MMADPLSALISSIAPWGCVGILAVALIERVVPILPSYGLLAAIGMAAAAGAWSIPAAFVLSTIGGLAGCLASYAVVAAVGEARSRSVVRWSARLAGLSSMRLERLTHSFEAHQGTLAFVSQLVPTVRLVAPAIAGLLRADSQRFAMASACGIALWNGIFIGVGYAVALLAAPTSISTLAFQILLVLLAGEGVAVALWHLTRSRHPGRRNES